MTDDDDLELRDRAVRLAIKAGAWPDQVAEIAADIHAFLAGNEETSRTVGVVVEVLGPLEPDGCGGFRRADPPTEADRSSVADKVAALSTADQVIALEKRVGALERDFGARVRDAVIDAIRRGMV